MGTRVRLPGTIFYKKRLKHSGHPCGTRTIHAPTCYKSLKRLLVRDNRDLERSVNMESLKGVVGFVTVRHFANMDVNGISVKNVGAKAFANTINKELIVKHAKAVEYVYTKSKNILVKNVKVKVYVNTEDNDNLV